MGMLFRQLFEPNASAYTYLIGCTKTGEAALIDPVLETVDRDLKILEELGLSIRLTIETHIHADHVTGASTLRERTGCACAFPKEGEANGADLKVTDGARIAVGTLELIALHSPGHTDDHYCYLLEGNDGPRIFTGDALLIDGCGRTDFQNGDPLTLYRSVHDKLFSLPPDTLVYPGHDYQSRRVSTIGQEIERNPRLGSGKSCDEFVTIMAGLNLPRPKKIDVAVRANRECGRTA
jgi:sulfur dioxygenase